MFLNRRWRICFVVLLGACLAGGVSSASAAALSGIPTGLGFGDQPEGTGATQIPADENGHFHVGSDNEPIRFFLDPDGDDWLKEFLVPLDFGLVAGDTFPVWEHLQMIPNPNGVVQPLTDWHEEIHTPDWQWNPSGQNPPLLIVHNFPGEPLTVPGGVGGDPPGTHVWFEGFPPLFPNPTGDPWDIWIHKELIYMGEDIPNSPGEILPVEVWEYPTTIPEPASVVLFSMGLVGLGMLSRRRR